MSPAVWLQNYRDRDNRVRKMLDEVKRLEEEMRRKISILESLLTSEDVRRNDDTKERETRNIENSNERRNDKTNVREIRNKEDSSTKETRSIRWSEVRKENNERAKNTENISNYREQEDVQEERKKGIVDMKSRENEKKKTWSEVVEMRNARNRSQFSKIERKISTGETLLTQNRKKDDKERKINEKIRKQETWIETIRRRKKKMKIWKVKFNPYKEGNEIDGNAQSGVKKVENEKESEVVKGDRNVDRMQNGDEDNMCNLFLNESGVIQDASDSTKDTVNVSMTDRVSKVVLLLREVHDEDAQREYPNSLKGNDGGKESPSERKFVLLNHNEGSVDPSDNIFVNEREIKDNEKCEDNLLLFRQVHEDESRGEYPNSQVGDDGRNPSLNGKREGLVENGEVNIMETKEMETIIEKENVCKFNLKEYPTSQDGNDGGNGDRSEISFVVLNRDEGPEGPSDNSFVTKREKIEEEKIVVNLLSFCKVQNDENHPKYFSSGNSDDEKTGDLIGKKSVMMTGEKCENIKNNEDCELKEYIERSEEKNEELKRYEEERWGEHVCKFNLEIQREGDKAGKEEEGESEKEEELREIVKTRREEMEEVREREKEVEKDKRGEEKKKLNKKEEREVMEYVEEVGERELREEVRSEIEIRTWTKKEIWTKGEIEIEAERIWRKVGEKRRRESKKEKEERRKREKKREEERKEEEKIKEIRRRIREMEDESEDDEGTESETEEECEEAMFGEVEEIERKRKGERIETGKEREQRERKEAEERKGRKRAEAKAREDREREIKFLKGRVKIEEEKWGLRIAQKMEKGGSIVREGRRMVYIRVEGLYGYGVDGWGFIDEKVMKKKIRKDGDERPEKDGRTGEIRIIKVVGMRG